MKKKIYILVFYCFSMNANNFYSVVLAGGVGERLWPLSRQQHPKQFLSLGSSKTLLEQSIDRLLMLFEPDHIWAVTAEQHADKMKKIVGNTVGNILSEPVGRNTAPAILYVCFELAKHNPDAVVLFVPADAFIPPSDYIHFQKAASTAYTFAQANDHIVLLGVRPTFPATGYGYIEFEHSEDKEVYPVARFHEKPSLKLAESYILQQNMLWNICMFCAKVSVFLEEFQKITPELYQQVQAFMAGKIDYAAIESISIDYALIEKSNHVSVVPVSFSWCDVGNIHTFLSIENQFHTLKKPIEIDAKNNLIDVPYKTVAIIGVDDLCVVETEDALLITKRDDAEKVRNVVKELKNLNQSSLL